MTAALRCSQWKTVTEQDQNNLHAFCLASTRYLQRSCASGYCSQVHTMLVPIAVALWETEYRPCVKSYSLMTLTCVAAVLPLSIRNPFLAAAYAMLESMERHCSQHDAVRSLRPSTWLVSAAVDASLRPWTPWYVPYTVHMPVDREQVDVQ
jgi:hypothetical protein